MVKGPLLIGCAGWAIPATERSRFPQDGSLLERYAQVFSAVEINSSFYRPHRATTYSRWAASVPEDFRFSVKLPKAITHTARLVKAAAGLKQFYDECSHLESKLGCLLIQLPPSLKWDAKIASNFFHVLREITNVDVGCEPRHQSWFTAEASAILDEYHIGRVIADPSPISVEAASPSCVALRYFRLHGSPQMYYSSYAAEYLEKLDEQLVKEHSHGRTCWCIFDNTAAGAATRNGLELLDLLSRHTE